MVRPVGESAGGVGGIASGSPVSSSYCTRWERPVWDVIVVVVGIGEIAVSVIVVVDGIIALGGVIAVCHANVDGSRGIGCWSRWEREEMSRPTSTNYIYDQ